MTVSLYNCGHCKLPQLVGQRCHCRTLEDEAFDELAKRQGMWGGGYQAKRQMAADKMQKQKILDPLTMSDDELIAHSSKQVQALRMALDMIECEKYERRHVRWAIIDALKEEALAQSAPPPSECKTEAEQTAFAFGWWKALESVRTKQPAQEPVGKFAKFTDGVWREVTDGSAGVPLYTTPPPQRPWVGLTPKETSGFTSQEMTVVKYVSKVLQEKNDGSR